MTISPRLACQLCAVVCGDVRYSPPASSLMDVLNAAFAEDITLAREFDRFRRHMPDYAETRLDMMGRGR